MRERIGQFAQAWGQLRQIDNKFTLFVLLGAAVGLVAGVGLGFLFPIGTFIAMPLLGILLALLGGLIVFNRRAQKAQFKALDGQLGAAAAILEQMRGQWFVNPAVSVNAKQDMVHRVVGRCGVVLVGEGSGQRVKGLLVKERKRMSKVTGDVPLHTFVVGTGEGDVKLPKLQMTINKLPRELKKTEVPKLERRLKPLDKAPPVPKGIDPFAASSRKRPKPR